MDRRLVDVLSQIPDGIGNAAIRSSVAAAAARRST
jgi:hypothetical protein